MNFSSEDAKAWIGVIGAAITIIGIPIGKIINKKIENSKTKRALELQTIRDATAYRVQAEFLEKELNRLREESVKRENSLNRKIDKLVSRIKRSSDRPRIDEELREYLEDET